MSTAGIRVGLEYVFWHMSQLGISSSAPPSGGGQTHSELDGQVVSHFVQEGSCGFLLTQQHQLQVQVPLEQEALCHKANAHYTPQGSGHMLRLLLPEGQINTCYVRDSVWPEPRKAGVSSERKCSALD